MHGALPKVWIQLETLGATVTVLKHDFIQIDAPNDKVEEVEKILHDWMQYDGK